MYALAKRQSSYQLVVVVRMVNTFAIFSTQLLTNLYILRFFYLASVTHLGNVT